MKIYKWKKYIDIGYWLLIIVLSLYYLPNLLGNSLYIGDSDYSKFLNIICNFLWSIGNTSYNYFFISIPYFTYQFLYNKVKIKIDSSDLIKEKNYYRDKIKTYSPGVLSYIDNFIIGDHTLVATIMYLELKDLIKANNKIELTNQKPINLDKNTSYVYRLINDNNLKDFDINKCNDLILSDCIKNKLIMTKEEIINISRSKIQKLTKNIIFTPLIIFIILSFIDNYIKIELPSFIFEFFIFYGALIVLLLMILPLIIISYLISLFFIKKSHKDNYIRSSISKELNIRLDGLNNFLKDFSNLKDKTKEELILWEDYLLYSVMFNHNEKVISDYQRIIKNTINDI